MDGDTRLVPVGHDLGAFHDGLGERHLAVDQLLVGLGNSAEYPDTYAVGLPGQQPVAMLDSGGYELWQWTTVAPSLWHACEVRAKVGAGLGDPTSATDLLDDVLGDLRPLLANSCAYLDVVRRG